LRSKGHHFVLALISQPRGGEFNGPQMTQAIVQMMLVH
jgi:hypothetical protein